MPPTLSTFFEALKALVHQSALMLHTLQLKTRIHHMRTILKIPLTFGNELFYPIHPIYLMDTIKVTNDVVKIPNINVQYSCKL